MTSPPPLACHFSQPVSSEDLLLWSCEQRRSLIFQLRNRALDAARSSQAIEKLGTEDVGHVERKNDPGAAVRVSASQSKHNVCYMDTYFGTIHRKNRVDASLWPTPFQPEQASCSTVKCALVKALTKDLSQAMHLQYKTVLDTVMTEAVKPMTVARPASRPLTMRALPNQPRPLTVAPRPSLRPSSYPF